MDSALKLFPPELPLQQAVDLSARKQAIGLAGVRVCKDPTCHLRQKKPLSCRGVPHCLP
jgi:hypothetical protein